MASKYSLGFWLKWGIDPVLKANPKIGFRLLTEAAEGGVVEAAFSVGHCHRHAIGCPENPEKAFEWYHRAALLGSRNAMGELAKIYYRGEVVTRNMRLAKIWEDAANQTIKPIIFETQEQTDKRLRKMKLAMEKKRAALVKSG